MLYLSNCHLDSFLETFAPDLLISAGLVIITVITVDEDKSKQIIFQNFLPSRQENNSNRDWPIWLQENIFWLNISYFLFQFLEIKQSNIFGTEM